MLDELVVLQRNFLPSERTPSIERRIAQLVSSLHVLSFVSALIVGSGSGLCQAGLSVLLLDKVGMSVVVL